MKKLLAAVTALTVSTAQADTIHVDDDNCPGPGDGSVGDPYCSIQTAIDNAADTDEIEVAPGTYFETINFLGKAVTLRSSDGPEVTIISANGPVGTDSAVTCASGELANTILEGFTLTDGTGTTVEVHPGQFTEAGGGMFNIDSSPTVTNCTFIGNGSGRGGGMANKSSSPTVTNCTFSGNSARVAGGMGNFSGSSPTVTSCTFSGNSAGDGGGMGNEVTGCPIITNCLFSGNSADGNGGAIGGRTTVIACTFIGNTAHFGGAISSGSNTIVNCTFVGNYAQSGGGIVFGPNSDPTVINCTFVGNNAGHNGGAMFNGCSSLTVMNCAFISNHAESNGGAMVNCSCSPIIINCTFSANSAAALGGAMASGCNASISPMVINCILWEDTPTEIVDQQGATTTVAYSNVQGGFSGTGNIDADPLFIDPDNGDYRLSPNSPCIDTGDNSAVPVGVLRDLDGNPRFVADACAGDSGATVDMGAYEFQGTSCDLGTMLEMLAAWGSCSDCGTCPADFDGDCSVGIIDLLILLGNWTV